MTGALLHAAVLAALVNPFIGTSGTKIGGPIDTFPGAVAPFGMVQFSPDTPSAPAGGGYDYADKQITGFSLDHLSGPGCSVFGDFAILPQTGTPAPPAKTTQPFSHASEVANPGYYAVTVGSPGIRVELTADRRSGIGRFTFPASEHANLLFNPASNQAGVNDATIRIVSPAEIEGSATTGNFCGMPDVYTVYFVAQFDRPMSSSGVWNASGPNAAAYASFDTRGDREVTVRVALSWVSLAGARANLEASRAATFNSMRAGTASRWENELQRVHVGGGTPAQQRIFYTALYHTLLHPNLYSDVDGRYRGFDGNVHRVRTGHDEYATFSGWDIYRSETPLLALIAPRESSDMMQSLVDAAHQGGWLPKWALVNGYTAVMGGDSADPIIAGAYAFGARDFDVHGALSAMLKNATDLTSPPGQGWYRPRPGLDEYLSRGYVVNTHTTNVSPVRNGASLTLEYALDDFSIARFALALHDEHAYRTFMGRSQSWRNLFDTQTGWIAPRGRAGAFEQTPITDNGQSGFQEGNAAQYTWMVPYDLASLIYGMGGRAAATARLDAFFTQINAGQDKPYAWLGNEPSLNAPWTYLSTGAPWKAQRIVRDALTTLYTDAPDGIPGNDDLGTMSAWYVFCAIGLYPPNPAVRGFDLGAPLFSSVRIVPPAGPRIDISAPAASTANAYVRGVLVNGKPVSKTWLALPERGAVRLTYDLASAPGSWGSAPADAPPSYPASAPRFAPSTDARFTVSASPVHVAPGSRARIQLGVRAAAGARVAWHASAPAGLLASALSGTIDKGMPATIDIAPPAGMAPHVYAVTIGGTAQNGALLEPVTIAAAVAPAGASIPLAYAANYSDNGVTAFDPRTGAIEQTIATGKNPADAALSADGSRVYVADQGSNDVTVIDAPRGRAIATVKVGKTPASIRISPDGATAWVSNYGDNTVQPIDLATLRAGTPIAVGRSPEQIAIAPDGNTVYVVNQSDNTVSIIDARTRHPAGTIATGSKPIAIVVAPDGRTAYVANQGSNDVTRIDLASRRAYPAIPAGVAPQGMAVSRDGSRLYVADSGSDTVSVLDLRRRTRIGEIRAGLNPVAVALTGGGKTLYVIAMGDNACVKIALTAPERRTAIDLGNVPIALALP